MRRPIRSKFAIIGAAVVATFTMIATAEAQTFPQRQITLVVAYSAGGPSDAIARIIGERMGRTLGQTIIIDNATGGGGTLAGDKVANAPPDGHTILIQHLALLAQNKMYPNVRYDPRTALVPIGLVNSGPLILVTRKSLPAKTPAELLVWLKANGEKVTAAHANDTILICFAIFNNLLDIFKFSIVQLLFKFFNNKYKPSLSIILPEIFII